MKAGAGWLPALLDNCVASKVPGLAELIARRAKRTKRASIVVPSESDP